MRVVLLGAIGEHKGYSVLLACARDARSRRLPLEFIVIGFTSKDAPLLATGKVFITGPYSEVEVPHLLRREQPDIAWLPSVWPETWCYTLDYALVAGLPVVAFDLGAIAERLRASDAGMLLPLELNPVQINDRLLALAAGSRPMDESRSRSVQTTLPRQHDDDNMITAQITETHMANTSEIKPSQETAEVALSASVQVLSLPAGLYLCTVRAAKAHAATADGQLSLPAVHVGLGPGVPSDRVEFGPSTHGPWLFAPGDLLVMKIHASGATLILTSVRTPGGDILDIKVDRLDTRGNTVGAASMVQPRTPVEIPAAQPRSDTLPLPVQIGAHIRTRGDMRFADVPWAGRVAPGLWIESFSVQPLELFGAQDIEYKGLTGGGFETAWLSDAKMCGTKGMATPLVGFAVRLKPNPAAAAYDCEYSGYFQSGATVGPLRNGAPCRSTVANDPLEGIQIRLVKRANTQPGVGVPVKTAAPGAASNSARVKNDVAPNAHLGQGKGGATNKSKGPVRAPIEVASPNGSPSRSKPPSRRRSNRRS
jgi:hypothetical protein